MKKLLSILLLTGATILAGCGDDDEFVVINPTNPIPAPICTDDAYTGNSNQPLTVNAATGVLANDTPNGATLTFSATSANGGTIVGAQDGSFVYTPAVGFVGADSFTYTLGNSGGVVTCTVNVTVNAVNGFFVDATNGNDGTGSFTNGLPFATVQAALTAAPAGSDIVVRPGNYTGAVNLDNGDRLLGSGSSLITPQGVVRPTLTGPVVLADGCTVDFIRVDGTAGDAIDGNGQNGGTVTNCEIANVTGAMNAAVEIDGSNGTWNVSNNSISNIGAVAIFCRVTGASTATFVTNNNQITNAQGAMGFVSEGTSNVNASVKGNTFTNSQGVGAAFELTCGDNSIFCLDLEDNTNDNVYSLLESPFGGAPNLRVEQLSVLTTAQPTGAGNTGTVNDNSGIGGLPISDVADGTCGF